MQSLKDSSCQGPEDHALSYRKLNSMVGFKDKKDVPVSVWRRDSSGQNGRWIRERLEREVEGSV